MRVESLLRQVSGQTKHGTGSEPKMSRDGGEVPGRSAVLGPVLRLSTDLIMLCDGTLHLRDAPRLTSLLSLYA